MTVGCSNRAEYKLNERWWKIGESDSQVKERGPDPKVWMRRGVFSERVWVME